MQGSLSESDCSSYYPHAFLKKRKGYCNRLYLSVCLHPSVHPSVHPCLQMTTYVVINGIFDTLVAKTSYVSSHIRSCLKLHKSTKGGNPCKF